MDKGVSSGRRVRRLAVIVAALAVGLAVNAPAGADRQLGEGHELIRLASDSFVRVPEGARALSVPSPLNGGFALASFVTGYAPGGYTAYLVDGPGAEQMRGRVAASLAEISYETGLALTLAAGLHPDRPVRSGEMLVRITPNSPCGWLTVAGGAIGCGGPRVDGGGRITSGEVWLAPGIECESAGIAVAAHELGHAFGLNHYVGTVDGLHQVMYPSTSSDAPMFRAGDRAGLRFLAGRAAAMIDDRPGIREADEAPDVQADAVADPALAAFAIPAALGAESTGAWFSPRNLGRVLDTRNGVGLAGRFGSGETRTLSLAGVLPEQVSAVAVNLTAVDPTAEGYVTAYPGGIARPATSSANYAPGSDAANFQIVAVGANNTIDLYNFGGSVHLLADVIGVFSASGDQGFVSRSPVRVLDTRESPVAGERGVPLGCDSAIGVDLDRIAATGAPPFYSAAVVNLTSIDASARGYVSLLDHWSTGSSIGEPATSNLNVAADSTRANLALTSGSYWSVYNGPGLLADSAVDLAGWFVDAAGNSTAASYVPVAPARVVDTRSLDSRGRFGDGETRRVRFEAPAGATAAVVNVTVAESASEGYLTLSPSGSSRPEASNVNYRPGPAIPNLAIIQLGNDTSIDVFVDRGTPHVIVDVVGFFVTAPR